MSTAITAGPGGGAGGVWLNHAEAIVVSTAGAAGGLRVNLIGVPGAGGRTIA